MYTINDSKLKQKRVHWYTENTSSASGRFDLLEA